MKVIHYTQGYRFQLEELYQHHTGLSPRPGEAGNRFVGMSPDGLLTIAAGYAWDGASGPAINTRTILRGSLVHDALYQLIRIGALGPEHRERADALLREICIADCMWPPRAWWVHRAVRTFGGHYLRNKPTQTLTAP